MPIAPRVNKSAALCFTCFLLLIADSSLAAAPPSFVLPQVMTDHPALPASQARAEQFITYDKTDYSKNQDLPKALRQIASNPLIYRAVKLMPNGDLVVYVSPDGHYYIPGDVNGFAVRFMVDSGAATSSIPARYALNAGIGVAVAKLVNTADGQITIGETSGNVITIGNARIANARIMVIDKLQAALLGAEVLNLFDISYSQGVMTIKAIEKISKQNVLNIGR
jgi:aspartyl protease family protein